MIIGETERAGNINEVNGQNLVAVNATNTQDEIAPSPTLTLDRDGQELKDLSAGTTADVSNPNVMDRQINENDIAYCARCVKAGSLPAELIGTDGLLQAETPAQLKLLDTLFDKHFGHTGKFAAEKLIVKFLQTTSLRFAKCSLEMASNGKARPTMALSDTSSEAYVEHDAARSKLIINGLVKGGDQEATVNYFPHRLDSWNPVKGSFQDLLINPVAYICGFITMTKPYKEDQGEALRKFVKAINALANPGGTSTEVRTLIDKARADKQLPAQLISNGQLNISEPQNLKIFEALITNYSGPNNNFLAERLLASFIQGANSLFENCSLEMSRDGRARPTKRVEGTSSDQYVSEDHTRSDLILERLAKGHDPKKVFEYFPHRMDTLWPEVGSLQDFRQNPVPYFKAFISSALAAKGDRIQNIKNLAVAINVLAKQTA